ncbi:hypothetical protein CFP65_5257 [Kitasatospora sp. MMS16-BH015]|uniref:hypothetical protein n=1 Tax=Kitasatospora sp. MMS16-BH015 TaxID=2018025 RepID=UPI000CA32181|nr:hypothetical protein [Kitasatospora sp. MMS16-BH015]AUG79966.1 hypothetical protein CFP65_5257 [Kitasatospora sp. MMS16-BH015]
MRVLAYEVRRLRGLRSTWFLFGAVLLADAVVTALLARQLPAGQLGVGAAVRTVTAVVPLLPLPIAALGAGALGALSYGHEVRHPGLAASRVSYRRRLGLLSGKLAVIGVVAVALAVATLAVDAVVLRLALAPGAHAGRLFTLAAVHPDHFGHPGSVLRPLVLFAAAVAVAAWTGLLVTSLVRSAAAGLLILCALPVLAEPATTLALRQFGPGWAERVRELLPFQYGLDRLPGGSGGLGHQVGQLGAVDPLVLAVLVAPPVLLLACSLLLQARRRAM